MPRSSPESSFQRLWLGFLGARVLVALALLALQVAGGLLQQPADLRLLLLCSLYLVVTLATRWLASPKPPTPQPGLQWLPLLGVDLLLVGLLQWQQAGSMNYTPLFGIPILMASVLGSLPLALGTTASATLVLLGTAWWRGADNTQEYLQAALTGTGYFIVAYLAHQLAQRLLSEQQQLQQSRQRVREQALVNALVIENLNDGVLVLDPSGQVHTANPAALQLLASAGNKLHTPFALHQQPAWEPLWAMVQIGRAHV